MAPRNELKRLVYAYNDLLEARKKAIGVVMSENCVERQHNKEMLDKQYASLELDTRLGRSSIRNTYFELFKKDSLYSVQEMLRNIDVLKVRYMNQTRRREEYGIITSVAFCAESDLMRYLGYDSPICDLTRTWHMDFQQHNVECTNTGLLEVVGVSRNDLIRWWTDGISDTIQEETTVWKDVKNLALRLVHTLDKVDKESDSWKSLSMVKLVDRESQRRLDSIVIQMMQIGQGLIRLLNIRQDYTSDILPLYEMLVPVVYAFSMTLSLDTKVWQTLGPQVISFLEEYVSSLYSQQDALVEQFEAGQEMKFYAHHDRNTVSTSQRSSCKIREAPAEPQQNEAIRVLREEIMIGLNKLGLQEKQVSIALDEPLGTGSFAKAYKGYEENEQQELAVKFLKFKPNNPSRIKNLLGFCIHPGQELPGLISPYCKYTLGQYLKDDHSAVGYPERLCYLFEIASGLDYMHKHEDKLAHGDLRPGNVLLVPKQLGNGYNAVLSDFGVSYPLEDIEEVSATSLQKTNELYLAPELLAKVPGKERMVTIPGDVYAFGCAFVEVIYNSHPFYYYQSSVKQLVKDTKSKNILPALEKDIQKIHWKFLKQTWDPKPQNRPCADELMFQIHKFIP